MAISPLIGRHGPGKKANLTRIKPLYASRGLPHEPCCHYRNHLRCVMHAGFPACELGTTLKGAGSAAVIESAAPGLRALRDHFPFLLRERGPYLQCEVVARAIAR